MAFRPGFKFAGVTLRNGGTATWEITGGVLGPFTRETEFDNQNFYIHRPGSPWWLREDIGDYRATGGVQKANLDCKGTYDVITNMVDHDYQRVICP
jgi:hypothetical protein